jgi:hypothetical protein
MYNPRVIDQDCYKKIVLNDRYIGYRPNKEIIERFRLLFPDIIILGFGRWNMSPTWYVLANSSKFPKNLKESDHLVCIAEAITWAKPYIVTNPPLLPTL